MKKGYPALLAGLALCAAGLAAWIFQIVQGLQVTNLSNLFSWGLYMGSFEFFIALATGGMLVFSIAYIWKVESLMPFGKLASLCAFANVAAAGVAIMTDLGQPFRVLQMLLTPNIGSPLFWDVVILGLYALITLAAVIIQFTPELKKNKGNRGALADAQDRSRKLSFVALPYLVILNAGTALMFAVQKSREWWHSAILPVDAVAVGLAAGVAIMLLVQVIMVDEKKYELWKDGFVILARIGAAALFAHFVFTFLEIVTISWNGGLEGKELLHIVFGRYGLLFFLEMALPFVAMIAWFFYQGGSRKMLGTMSALVVISMFIQKMMHLLPAFNVISLSLPAGGAENKLWSFPISSGFFKEGQDLFVRSWDYMPTLPEIAVGLLPVGILIIILAGANVLFSVISEVPGLDTTS